MKALLQQGWVSAKNDIDNGWIKKFVVGYDIINLLPE